MDLALTRPQRRISVLAFVSSSVIVGACAWVGDPQYLPLALAFPALWALTRSRWEAFAVAITYYLVAARDVPAGAQVFFQSSTLLAVALLIAVAVILAAVWAVAWHQERRVVRALLALAVTSLPPVGIVGWANPITAAGILFPGLAWWGFGLAGMLLAAIAWRPVVAVPAIVIGLLVPFSPPEAPPGWRAVQTRYAVASGVLDLNGQRQRHQELSRIVMNDARSRVIVLPETVLGTWYAPSAWLWQPAMQVASGRGQTVIAGAEWPHQIGYDNIAGRFRADGSLEPVYRQMMPVPVSMWVPWRDGMARPAWFSTAAVEIDGHRTAFLICYEQLLVWPVLMAMLKQPHVLVGLSNDWWARNTRIPAIQRASLTAWARLFGTHLLVAENL